MDKNKSMKIYGLLNCTTKEKFLHDIGDDINDLWLKLSKLPCGVYKDWDLECKECDGTGGGEEVSGGHKKECEACSGSGIDPVLLKEFEELPIDSVYWGSAWIPHSNCTKNCQRYSKKGDWWWNSYHGPQHWLADLGY